jgi:hypothetical protein
LAAVRQPCKSRKIAIVPGEALAAAMIPVFIFYYHVVANHP